MRARQWSGGPRTWESCVKPTLLAPSGKLRPGARLRAWRVNALIPGDTAQAVTPNSCLIFDTEDAMTSRCINRCIRWMVLILAALLLATAPVTFAQTSPSAVSVFSIWVRLSLRGLSQEEIESVLRNMDPKTINEVKARLRRTVLANLQLKKVGEHIQLSRDSDDLSTVISSIETEIRFAGMQNDDRLKLEIKDRYGVRLGRF